MFTLLNPKAIKIRKIHILFTTFVMSLRELTELFFTKKIITKALIVVATIAFQGYIVLAQEADSLEPNKPIQSNSPETPPNAQRAAKKLNLYINNHEGFRLIGTGTVNNVGIAGNSITKQYMKILTQKLTKSQMDLDKLRKYGAIRFENKGYAVYRGTLMDLKQIERTMLVASVLNAGSELYKKTKLSKKIKRLEKKIARYCVVEYSKAESGKAAELYMPGDLDEKKRKEQKEYRVAFSSLFTPDEESLKMDLNVNLTTFVYKTNAVSSYSFIKKETTLRFSSQALNTYTGVNMGMSMVKKKQSPMIYLFKTKIAF